MDAFNRKGIPLDVLVLEGHSDVNMARNHCLRLFLESDCTDMVFVDSDVGWEAGDFIRLVEVDGDIVAGVHRHKNDNETYPIDVGGEDRKVNEHGLHPMPKVGTGFMRLRRAVVQRLHEWEVERGRYFWAKPEDKRAGRLPVAWIAEHAFTAELGLNITDAAKFNSEDYVICLKARNLGFSVFADIEIPLRHEGAKVWAGRLGDHLRQQQGTESPGFASALTDLIKGDASPSVFDRLVRFSPWFPLPAAALKGLYEAAKAANGDVLECGSGVSTLVIAAALAGTDRTAHVLEEGLVYCQQMDRRMRAYGLGNVILHYVPLMPHDEGNWYGIDPGQLPAAFSVALIDGPHDPSLRSAVYSLLGDRLAGAVVIEDDAALTKPPALPGHTVQEVFGEQRAWRMATPRTGPSLSAA